MNEARIKNTLKKIGTAGLVAGAAMFAAGCKGSCGKGSCGKGSCGGKKGGCGKGSCGKSSMQKTEIPEVCNRIIVDDKF